MMGKYQAAIALCQSKDSLIFDGFSEGPDGIEISLESVEGEHLKVFFNSYLAYLCRDEGDMVRVWAEIERGTKGVEFIYLIQNSRFLKFFNDEFDETMGSYHIGLKHWMIMTMNQVFDVISKEEPLVIRKNHPQ